MSGFFLLFDAESAIYGLALTNDDRYLAVAARGNLQVWELSTHARLGSMNNTQLFFENPVFSPDGSQVLTALVNGSVGVYSIPALEELSALEVNEEFIADIQFSPDGKFLVVVGARAAYLYSFPAKELLAKWPCRCHTSLTGTATFSSGGQLLIIVDNEAITAYATDQLRTHSAHREPPTSVYRIDISRRDCMTTLLSEDGKSLLCGVECDIETRDPFTGRLLGGLSGHKSAVQTICRTSSGRICSFGADNTMRIWDLATQNELALLRDMDETMTVIGLHQSSRVVSGGIGGEVRLWETDPELLAMRPKSNQVFDTIGVESFSPPAISGDGQWIIHVTQPTLDGETRLTNQVRLDHLQNPKNSRTLTLDESKNLHTSVVTLPGDDLIAVGMSSGEVIVWSLKDNKEAVRFQAHDPCSDTANLDTTIQSATLVNAVLPRHRILVTLQNAEPVNYEKPSASSIRFWSLDTWCETTELVPPQVADGVFSMRFSIDETHCAVKPFNGDGLGIWNLTEGQLVRSVEGLGASFCPVDPQEYVVYQYGGQIDFLRLDRKTAVGSMRAHGDRLNSVAYLPDGQRIATASDEEGAVRIWDVRARRLMLTLTGVGDRPTLEASSRGDLILEHALGPRGGLINVWRAMSDVGDNAQ